MKYLKVSVILFISFLSAKTFAQTTIDAKDAAKHLNEKATVCGQVAGGKYLTGANITFLDMGESHPNELLTIVIKGDDRKKFKTAPEEAFKGKKVCVTGQIIDYKGKPEIIVTDPEQVKVSE